MAKVQIKQNQWGNWYGYVGNKRVEMFFGGSYSGYGSMEWNAQEWLKEHQCQAFLGCEQEAVTSFPHPILGDVRSCERCKAKLAEAA